MGNEIRRKIQTAYTALRPSEKKVADYLLAYRGRPGDLLMEELSRDAKVSQPTIVRFVKALGYKGFKDFKYAMIEEELLSEHREENGNIELYGFKLTSQDKLEEIPGKIITTSIQMLEETLKSIQTREYKRAVEAILKAENIVIYSVENSVCTANDLLTKLTYLGLNCRQYSDYYLQHVSAVNMTPKDLAIGISYSGYSKNTVEMMRLAKKAGAKTLVLTNFENALTAEYADILLCASHRQFLYGDTIFSRISQLALVDMIYAGVLNRDYAHLSGKLRKTSDIVMERAYTSKEEMEAFTKI